MKHIRNIYLAVREIGTTLEYSLFLNVEEKDKTKIYEKEKQGYNVIKVLANE